MKKEVVMNSPVFEQVSSEEIESLLVCLGGQKRHFPAGATIMEYDGTSKKVGIIGEGIVKLIRIDYLGEYCVLERMEKSDIFGETVAYSSFARENEQIIAQSETACEIVFLDAGKILRPCAHACSRHLSVLENLFTIISNKTRLLSRRLEIISHRTTRAKLLCFFAMETQRQEREEIRLPYSVSELAEYLCIDRCAMSREISKMKKEGLLEMERRRVRLKA